MADARFCVEYAKTGRSGCKKCKAKIDKGGCRIGKITTNPFSDDGGDMKVWYHPQCIFETFKRARATTKKIETPADVEGFADLEDQEKDEIRGLIQETTSKTKSPSKAKSKKPAIQTKLTLTTTPTASSTGASPSKKPPASSSRDQGASGGDSADEDIDSVGVPASSGKDVSHRDDSFFQFRRLCEDLEKEPSYNAKTKLVSNYIKFGNSGKGFTGDLYLLTKLLLPGTVKRVYNLQSKQIVKVLSQTLQTDLDDMVEDLEHGDVAETARKFFEQSPTHRPAKKSTLTLSEVDSFLERLASVTKEDDQKREMTKIVKRCTADDLKYIIRLIKHDLRINAGAKHILDALDANAYPAFQVSHDLKDVVDRVLSRDGGDGTAAKPGLTKGLSIRLSLMTPVKPMLAEACRSVAIAMKKCPNGMFAEVKYDGERVQVHKQGDQFQYFSRSLKPVQAHKVAQVKDFIPKACPHGDSMILDSEVLLVDNQTGDPLPFGTLGVHKKTAFKDATCCLFVFDILYFNGQSLLDRPIIERRKLLEQNLKEVKNHIVLAEQTLVRKPSELSGLIAKVIKKGLEGLVLKDTRSIYEPGKRHWLKVKKDYLEGGAMADTADLIVLGAYYGTGNKGGMMSVFLMGVYDKSCDKFRTVCKCGNGHDDATIERLQTELKMVKISKDASKVPSWLLLNKTLVPDLVVADPKAAPIWEITGAEFTKSTTHTAGGISIRFPRVTRIRDDKDWSTATELARLKTLFATSKENLDIKMSEAMADDDNADEEDDMDVDDEQPSSSRKRPLSSSDEAVDSPRKKPKTKSPSKASPAKSLAKPSPAKSPAKPSPAKSPSKPSPAKSPAKPPPSKPSPSKGKATAVASPTKAGTKSMCKYGVKCYQKSKKHKEQFAHPQDVDSSTAASSVLNPLPDLFSGMKFVLDPSLDDAKELTRFLIAYDGEVLKEYDSSDATHVITDTESFAEDLDTSESVLILKPTWVHDCLKQKRLLPHKKYKL